MASSTLPIHPCTGLRALGITPKGHIVWPILGAEDDPANPVQPPAKADPKPDLSWDDLRSQFEEQGLNPGQVRGRLDASRKWEEGAKAIKPDELASLREKAARADALEYELASDKEKAVADARKDAEAKAREAFAPAVVSAHLDAAAARAGVSEDDLAKAIEFVDTTKFFAEDGSVDTDKVKAFVSTIAPAKGTEPPQRRGPSSSGLGRRESTATAASVAAGRDLWRSRHPQKTT